MYNTYKNLFFVCALVIRARFPTFTLFSLSLPPSSLRVFNFLPLSPASVLVGIQTRAWESAAAASRQKSRGGRASVAWARNRGRSRRHFVKIKNFQHFER